MEQSVPASPIWLRVLQFPLTRLVLPGGIALHLMAWADEQISAFKDSPLTGLPLP